MADERHRVMIHRTNARTLEDGCYTCNKSAVFCAANRAHNGQPCCRSCRHRE